ncbi:MAG: hypothetical protein QM296_10595 [Bacillota bacterium]|nr:hypothetical protein [Bacillota bacterium]
MKTELHNYDIFPKVFLLGEAVNISIRPLGDHVAFTGNEEFYLISVAHGAISVYPWRSNLQKLDVALGEDGCVRFTHVFPEEGEYLIRMLPADSRGRKIDLSVYALAEDMRGRYPYRGDLHMHSCYSDGQQSPAVVVANYRKYGYDFTVISDHERYYPSLEAQNIYRDIPTEMTVVAGEEIHLPDNDVHIVNFGGKYSVNGLLETSAQNRESERRALIPDPPPVLSVEEYRQQVNELARTLDIPDGIEAFSYASCVWIFDHIRQSGGLGIFAHPYWKSDGSYQVPESLTAYLLETHPFDAFEVLGGELYQQQNGFQAIRYYEDRARGIHYPIIGATDSHNSIAEDNPGALVASTFVFATANETDALIAAIRDEYSVAVDTISKEYRLVGDLRLVKYTRFLLDDFTPLHDELCFEEGRLMKAWVTGDTAAREHLARIHGRMKALYRKYFRL